MESAKGTIEVDRDLTEAELELLTWLIGKSKAKDELLSQLEGISVVGECPCGCASFDLQPNSDLSVQASGKAQVEFKYNICSENDFCDGFLWVSGGWLAGVDLCEVGDAGGACQLPTPNDLLQVKSC